MKKPFAILTVLSLLLAPFFTYKPAFSRNPSKRAQEYVEGRILVQMRQGARINREAGPLTDRVMPVQDAEVESLDETPADGLFVVNVTEGMSVEEAVRLAESDPRVEYAEPDYILRPSITPDDAFFGMQWGLRNTGDFDGKPGADIAATQVWDVTQGSQDVVVAVIDTGTDLSHPDIQANAWINPREVAGNGVDDDGNGLVDDINGWNFRDNNNNIGPAGDFHGTHVAGIVGAVGNNSTGVTGVAWRVKLMALKFISGLEGSTSDAVKAINYATAQRKLGENLRVINASWGGPGNANSLRKAIKKAGKAGILFVNSAGNGGEDSRGDDLDVTPDYPSAWSTELNTIISVAALDRSDNLPSFSNFGHKTVNVGAPGVQVLSTFPGGGYNFLSGTSMAAPHVSGTAVLIWTREPALTPSQVRQRIISSAQQILSLGSKSTSAARVNAFNAVTGAAPSIPAPGINRIETNKKVLTLDGIGFRNGSTEIDVNGAVLSKVKFSADHQLSNGTFTRTTVKLGKVSMDALLPIGISVVITVTDTITGEHFSIPYTRN